jgi:hypothetical protein
MDSSITAAGRALCAGDPLGALKRVALRDDPAALALRGTAMAQLGAGRGPPWVPFNARWAIARSRTLLARTP